NFSNTCFGFQQKDEQIEEENVYLKQLKRIKQIFQKFYIPQYPEVYQQQIVMNPWKHVKTTTYPVPIPVSSSFLLFLFFGNKKVNKINQTETILIILNV
uniref:Alpha-S2-casein-like A n=1 Tax=Oryctolagus cuniculus TaxID=9986 RepID=A0A5S8I4V2_RABIT